MNMGNGTPNAEIVQKYTTVTDAARMLGVNIQRVRQLVRQEKLIGVRVGKCWLVLKSSIESRLQQFSRRTSPAARTRLYWERFQANRRDDLSQQA